MFYLPWYTWLAIAVCAVLTLILLVTFVYCCCCRKENSNEKKKKQKLPYQRNTYGYDGLPADEFALDEEEEDDDVDGIHSYGKNRKSGYRPSSSSRKEQHQTRSKKSQQDQLLTYYVPAPHHKAIDRVAQYNESGAESSFSDADHQSVSVSAYGDLISRSSNDSRSSFARKPGDLAIQASLIYSRESKYVAGKIVTIDGIRPQLASLANVNSKNLVEIKCHVVILPMKKYALKTNWYPIKKERVKMDEYFKFKFKELPPENKTTLRLRLYGRKGAIGRSHCLGECYVNMREIVTSRGGLTLWRKINTGVPEIVDLE